MIADHMTGIEEFVADFWEAVDQLSANCKLTYGSTHL